MSCSKGWEPGTRLTPGTCATFIVLGVSRVAAAALLARGPVLQYDRQFVATQHCYGCCNSPPPVLYN